MKTKVIIDTLIDTVICGNKIKGNGTYEKMLNSITFKDVRDFFRETEYEINGVYWVPFGSYNTRAKNSDGEFISKIELFEKYIKKSF